MLPLVLRRLLLIVLALPLLAGSCSPVEAVLGVPRSDGSLPLEIRFQAAQDAPTATVTLDGVDVTSRFTVAGATLRGSVPLPPPGVSTLRVTLHRVFAETIALPVPSPAAAPALLGLDPAPVAGALPRSSWLRLRFAASVPAAALDGTGFGVECNGATVARRAIRAGDTAVILDPTPSLPAAASCRVAWRGPAGTVVETTFSTPSDVPTPVQVLHDRDDPSLLAPFPDDYYLVADAATRTGLRVSIPDPPYSGMLLQVYQGVLGPANSLDGWSRISPIVLAFSAALDPSLVPVDAFGAQDPFAPIALFDVDPASPDYGQRIPYEIQLRTDVNHVGQVDYSALVFPSIALRPRGHYALVVTRRLFASQTPGSALSSSPFFDRAAGAAMPGESTAVTRARSHIAPVLSFLETVPAVPIAREDVALVLPISVRSDDDIPQDLLAIKEDTLAKPPPPLSVGSVTPMPDGSVVLRGTVALPSYLQPVYKVFVHDAVTGRPVQQGSEAVPFVLQLPRPDAPSPAPIVMYQHGNPGSPEELLSLAKYLHDAGFAVGGIEDVVNRQLGSVEVQISATFFFVLQTRAVPDFWNQTGADMIAFLRALQGLSGTGWRPPGTPQTPLLDTTRLFYHGISEGGNNALRFLPYAPELLAATPTVGGGRLTETLIHQTPTLLAQLESFIGTARPVQELVGLSLFQHGYDAQDAHSYARFVNQAPLSIPGVPGARAPSILVSEGIGDDFVPNNATRSAVRELGIPSVRPLREASPVLTEVDGPLRANLAPDRTGGHFQYDSATTPGCGAGYEPHYCPQVAPLAQLQRLFFFQSAIQGPAPWIVDPIPPSP